MRNHSKLSINFKSIKLPRLIRFSLCFFAVAISSGCSSFSSRPLVTSSEESVGVGDVLKVKEEKLTPEARFLYDSTYQKSILSTCSQNRKYLYPSSYGQWYEYSDCKFKFYDAGDYETSLNVHIGDEDKSIDAVSYMEFLSTKNGQILLDVYGDGVISSKDKYCSVYGIGAHMIVKVVKPALCEALVYRQV